MDPLPPQTVVLVGLAIALLDAGGQAAGGGIVWDRESIRLVCPGAHYGRIVRLGSGCLLCSYTRGRRVCTAKSDDNGVTWTGEAVAGSCPHGVATNAALLQLVDGPVLLAYNERPKPGSGKPYTIMLCESRDEGREWSKHRLLYAAGTEAQDGCWEPAMAQLPDGEVQLFFANEAPYRQSSEQEISLMRSADAGHTWTEAATVSFRPKRRDGMPVPLVLRDGRGIVVAIEDNGLSNGRPCRLRPAIVYSSLKDNWRLPAEDGATHRRWEALANPLPRDVYAGAPYLVQFPSGETVLSVQSCEGGRREPHMVVYVGDARARNFSHPSIPVRVPSHVGVKWNSLWIKDADTVTAVFGTTLNRVHGLWTMDGRIQRGADRIR